MFWSETASGSGSDERGKSKIRVGILLGLALQRVHCASAIFSTFAPLIGKMGNIENKFKNWAFG